MTFHRADAHPTPQPAVPPTGNTAPTNVPKVAPLGRPSFGLEESTEKWEYFMSRWSCQKTAGNIQTQLIESCSEQLRFALFQSDYTISTKPETEILVAI